MPSRLRPKASVAADAILVGDPGRALLLAQELLEQPKMSNHARGLWGYSGRTPADSELTIQATGMGGPSAAAVLADLAKLGVRRAVRVGTCVGLVPNAPPGRLIAVTEAIATGGSATSFGLATGEAVKPDPELSKSLAAKLGGELVPERVGSFDAMPPDLDAAEVSGVAAADMQTVAILARGRQLGIAAAAVLIVAETATGERLADEPLEEAAKRLGRAAASGLAS
jgi:purine-nucleoside phosphorylase